MVMRNRSKLLEVRCACAILSSNQLRSQPCSLLGIAVLTYGCSLLRLAQEQRRKAEQIRKQRAADEEQMRQQQVRAESTVVLER